MFESSKKNHARRNGFSLNRHVNSSMLFGIMLPFYKKDTIPNDYFKVHYKNFGRIRSLNTAAFATIKHCVKFFHVNYHDLWAYWDKFITSMPQGNLNNSSALQQSGNTVSVVAPSAYIVDIVSAIRTCNSVSVNGLVYDCRVLICRILDSLEILPYHAIHRLVFGTSAFTTDYLNSNYQRLVNIMPLLAWNKILQDTNLNTDFQVRNPSVFNVDDLGANAILGYDRLRSVLLACVMRPLLPRDYFTDIRPNALYADWNISNQLSPRIKAYQGSNGVFLNDFGQQKSVSLSNPNNSPGENSFGGNAVSAQGFVVNNDSTENPNVTGNGTRVRLSIDSLRNAFALEKWAETSRRANKNYSSQILAHFGYKPSRSDRNNMFAEQIGGTTSNININQVLANADTSSAKLGEVGGMGVENTECSFKYKADDFGVVIGLHYYCTAVTYSHLGLSADSVKLKASDFFTPEAMNLGYQPIFKYNYSICDPSKFGSDAKTTDVQISDVPIFWQTRYEEMKRDYNRVLLDYADSNNQLSSFVAPVKFDISSFDRQGGNTNSANLATWYNIIAYLNPNVLDSVVSDVFDPTKLDADFIDNDTQIDVSAVRSISRMGLPY